MYAVPKISLLLSALSAFGAQYPVVNLGYASYRGVTNKGNGVSQWLGMRYAAAPVGNLRFAAPVDPPQMSGIQDATQPKPYCLSIGNLTPAPRVTSEDCLYVDVFSPSDATNTSALPVFVFIQGGGFAGNANPNFDGKGLIAASDHKIVVVSFNYRAGAYGFISGATIQSPNNGLKDQRKLLEWVQRHIASFGGDPKHVVLGGDSAGAASITLHLSAYGGRNDHLFHAAAAESQSFPTMLTVKEAQFLYDELSKRTGCARSRTGSLACLRTLPVRTLQRYVAPVTYPGQSNPPLYSWTPVIDGDLIQDYTYRAFNEGKFIHMPTIFGDDTNGGTIFAPRNTETLADSNRFLRANFPYLTDSQVDRLNKLYPNPNIKFPSAGAAGAYWRQLANVYGDLRYMCPGPFLSTAFTSRDAPSWNYRYNVQDPQQMDGGLGVPHTVEVGAIFGPGNLGGDTTPASYLPGKLNADIIPLIQGYWTSFIRSFDPNTHRLPGSATWDQWNAKDMNRYLFDTPVKNSKMETVDNGLRERCEYMWSIAISIKQ